MIEEEHIRFVAAADVTDDCRVEVQLRKPCQTLTISQARALVVEIASAADAAERYMTEVVRQVEQAAFDVLHIHPECVAGKCGNCDGETMAADDSMVPCEHHCHGRTAA